MNKLYKALIYDRQVSLSVLETTELVQKAIEIHNLGEKSAEILGGMLTAAAYMAGCLKSEKGAVSLTVKAGEGGATVSVSGDSKGHIRGYIDGNGGSLTGGTLTVVKDDGFFRPFVGTCDLVNDGVSECLMRYFFTSEQIPTAVCIGVKLSGGKCVAAGSVVMQLLPGTSEENTARAEEAMQDFLKVADLIESLGAEGIVNKYFADELKDGGLYLTFPEYKCNCSRAKIEGVIASLGKAECLDIIKESGRVSVHCHYCNKDYEFFLADVEKLFEE